MRLASWAPVIDARNACAAEARPLVVARRVDDARRLEVHHELGRLGVEPAELRRRHRRRRSRPAGAGGGSRSSPGRCSRTGRGSPRRPAPAIVGSSSGERPVDHPGQDVRAEAAPDDGAGASDVLGVRRQARRAARGPRRRSCPARCASRISRPSRRASSSSAASSSSMWSGIPFVRSWTASTTSRGAGSSPPRIRVVAVAVSSSVSGSEPGLLGVALAEQPRPPFAVDRVGRELVGAIAAEEEQRALGPRAGRARR